MTLSFKEDMPISASIDDILQNFTILRGKEYLVEPFNKGKNPKNQKYLVRDSVNKKYLLYEVESAERKDLMVNAYNIIHEKNIVNVPEFYTIIDGGLFIESAGRFYLLKEFISGFTLKELVEEFAKNEDIIVDNISKSLEKESNGNVFRLNKFDLFVLDYLKKNGTEIDIVEFDKDTAYKFCQSNIFSPILYQLGVMSANLFIKTRKEIELDKDAVSSDVNFCLDKIVEKASPFYSKGFISEYAGAVLEAFDSMRCSMFNFQRFNFENIITLQKSLGGIDVTKLENILIGKDGKIYFIDLDSFREIIGSFDFFMSNNMFFDYCSSFLENSLDCDFSKGYSDNLKKHMDFLGLFDFNKLVREEVGDESLSRMSEWFLRARHQFSYLNIKKCLGQNITAADLIKPLDSALSFSIDNVRRVYKKNCETVDLEDGLIALRTPDDVFYILNEELIGSNKMFEENSFNPFFSLVNKFAASKLEENFMIRADYCEPYYNLLKYFQDLKLLSKGDCFELPKLKEAGRIIRQQYNVSELSADEVDIEDFEMLSSEIERFEKLSDLIFRASGVKNEEMIPSYQVLSNNMNIQNLLLNEAVPEELDVFFAQQFPVYVF